VPDFGKPQARQAVDFSGFRGAALNQSQRLRCVYWLPYDKPVPVGTKIAVFYSGKDEARKWPCAKPAADDIPLPRSLTRCARAFGCGERRDLQGRKLSTESGDNRREKL